MTWDHNRVYVLLITLLYVLSCLMLSWAEKTNCDISPALTLNISLVARIFSKSSKTSTISVSLLLMSFCLVERIEVLV